MNTKQELQKDLFWEVWDAWAQTKGRTNTQELEEFLSVQVMAHCPRDRSKMTVRSLEALWELWMDPGD